MDFRPDNLAAVDHIIVTKFAADEDEDTIAAAVQAFGAYVGEVVRQNCGGTWRDEEVDHRPVLLVGPAQKRLDPFAAVRQRFWEPKESSMVGRVLGGHQVLSRLVSKGFTLADWFQSVCHDSR